MNKILFSVTFFIVLISKSQTVIVNPNPFDQSTLASFTLASNDTVTMQIVNSIGQIIYSPYLNTYLSAGIYNDSILLNNFPPGIYYLFFKTNLGGIITTKLVKQGPLGIKQIAGLPLLSVYPNPVSDYLIIVNPQSEKLLISITDSEGRIIYKSTEENKSEIKVEIDGFCNGVYFIKFQSADYERTSRVIKE
jgi:hypothetical protein